MKLQWVAAQDLRNLKGRADLDAGLNILIGENGQGKTNWLEAIYFLSNGTSFRTSRRAESISFGASAAVIEGGVLSSADLQRDLSLRIETEKKSFFINEKKATSADFTGNLYCIVFNAGEMDVVRGQPESRRRFLDDSVAGLHPPYIRTITDHTKVMKQKNALLQQAADGTISRDAAKVSLEAWNDELAKLAKKIHTARTRLVERLRDAMDQRLFMREKIEIRYVSSFEDKGDLSDYEGLVRERLAIRMDAEMAAGRSLIGPHRDDLEIKFDGADIRKFGSAGQQRSSLLQLLLAGMSVYHSTTGDHPVFLIDDIDAELDYRRIGNLLDHLSGKCQTVVTTSKDSFVERFGTRGKTMYVKDGSIHAEAMTTTA